MNGRLCGVVVALTGIAVAQRPAAVDDYRAGRYQAAHAAFAAELAALGDAAPVELRADLALVALRLQRTADAERACRPLLDHAEPVWRARGEFLLGLAAWQRSDRAAAAAQVPDPEPMAWDLAVRATEDAVRHWCRAAALKPDDTMARRNAERAQLRLAEQQRARDAAARRRAPPREPAPPPPTDAAGATEVATPELVHQPLSAAELRHLRERLRTLDRTKQALRQSAQRRAVRVGERDW